MPRSGKVYLARGLTLGIHSVVRSAKCTYAGLLALCGESSALSNMTLKSTLLAICVSSMMLPLQILKYRFASKLGLFLSRSMTLVQLRMKAIS